MNGTFKALLTIRPTDILGFAFAVGIVYAGCRLLSIPFYPLSTCIGAFIGTRIGNYLEYRRSR